MPILAFDQQVPVLCNAFAPTRAAALSAPMGELRLAICGECTLLWNTAFEPARTDYATNYDNSLHFSGVFGAYTEALARRLAVRYPLRGKRVVEIGCGDGAFLDRLCELGGAVGVGYDPSYARKTPRQFRAQVSVECRLFEPADRAGAALIVARHVLEHVADPAALLRSLGDRRAGDDDAAIYIEVPSADFMLRTQATWDLIYEHPTYFTATALARALAESGWCVTDGGESFHGQYLWMEAVAGGSVPTVPFEPDHAHKITEAALRFGAAFGGQLAEVDAMVRSFAGDGPLVAWGAGSKCVTMLNLLPSWQTVTCAVDINPAKQGAFVPGTGHAVVAPAALRQVAPATVLLMNDAYREEVGMLVAHMGIEARIASLPESVLTT